jgi:hypothetical protein
MDTLKPSPGILLNPAHPLARNLIGCWLLNEGGGARIYDRSTSGNTGTLQVNTCFGPGRFGTGLLFDGSGDYVALGSVTGVRATIALWCKPVNDASTKGLYGYSAGGVSRLDLDIENNMVCWTGVNNWSVKWQLSAAIDPTQWCHICVQCGTGGARLYVNGRLAESDPDEYCFDSWAATAHRIGWDYHAATDQYFNGTIDHVLMYNRTLSAGEIAQLYNEPFAMFRSSERRRLASVAGRTYRLLSGTITATTSLTATASVIRRLQGVSAAHAELSGRLSLAGIVDLSGRIEATTGASLSLSVSRERSPAAETRTRTPWRREVLFNGATSSALGFGTALTRGWFWTRPSGCSAVYRGRSLAEIDFADPICILDANAFVVTIPSHIHHKPGLSCCYVVRRLNSRGHIERTTSGAVRLHLDPDGQQAKPESNPVLALCARLIAANRVRLFWLYCPVHQQSPAAAFSVYWDRGTGHIDWSRPLADVAYKGHLFHQYDSNSLEAGRYTFAVQSRSASDAGSPAVSVISIQIPHSTCPSIPIIGAV